MSGFVGAIDGEEGEGEETDDEEDAGDGFGQVMGMTGFKGFGIDWAAKG